MTKKLMILLLALTFMGGAIFADYSPSQDEYSLAGIPYTATSVRLSGMGGAGLGVEGYSDSFLDNPANLGRGKFSLSLPTLTVTMFNPKKLVEGTFFPDLQNFLRSSDVADAAPLLTDLLSTLTKGQNEVERIDAGFNLTAGPVGVAVQAQQKLFGYLNNASWTDGSYVVETTAAVTLGLGFRFKLPIGERDAWSIDAGVHARLVYKLYSESITATKLLGLFGGGDTTEGTTDFLSGIKLISGYSIPISVGVNFNMPFGFKLSAVGRNINGKYAYTVNDSFNAWLENFDLFKQEGSESFSHDAGFMLDAGFTWKPTIGKVGKWIQPTLAIDMLDLTHIKSASDTLAHLYAGAQVRLFSFLDVRYGIAQGYQSVGIGLDLFVFHIDASYWRASYGENLLDKSIDAVSVRFSLITK